MTQSAQLPRPALDAAWYDRFAVVGATQVYEYLVLRPDDMTAMRNRFLRGELIVPELRYPRVQVADVTARREALLALDADIARLEQNALVQQAYHARIAEKLTELDLLDATHAQDASVFSKATHALYGYPTKRLFTTVVAQLRERVARSLDASDAAFRGASRQVYAVLPEVSQSDAPAALSPDTVQFAHRVTSEYITPLLQIPAQALCDAHDIQTAFRYALQQLGITEWTVLLDPAVVSISADHNNHELHVPPTKSITPQRLRSLIAHEIATHVARQHHGERSGLQLLGLGLDHYERAEEGIATLRDQALAGGPTGHAAIGEEGYLAIGLALGLDGLARNFREVFDIMHSYYIYNSFVRPKALRVPPELRAWNRTFRTFRGTTGLERGACFTKDIIYLEGNVQLWEVLHDRPDEIYRFNAGKYDPTNPTHCAVLDGLQNTL